MRSSTTRLRAVSGLSCAAVDMALQGGEQRRIEDLGSAARRVRSMFMASGTSGACADACARQDPSRAARPRAAFGRAGARRRSLVSLSASESVRGVHVRG